MGHWVGGQRFGFGGWKKHVHTVSQKWQRCRKLILGRDIGR